MRWLLAALGGALALGGVALGLLGVHADMPADGLLGSVLGGLATAVALIGLGRPERRTEVTEEDGGGSVVTEDQGYGDLALIADRETGLMNAAFFAGLVPTKLATARRRLWPLSIVLMTLLVDEAAEGGGQLSPMAAFAQSVVETIRAADVACRVGPVTIALVLDDTDHDGAAWVAERVQIHTARRRDARIAKVCAGVASYPAHGIEAEELLATAREALERSLADASGPGLGPVVVAPARPL
jgi:type IV secretory pathway VirB2 component (pilin)